MRLSNLVNSVRGEYELIGMIWTNKYPEGNMYSLSFLEKFVMSLLVFIRSLSPVHLNTLFIKNQSQSQASECYVLVCFAMLCMLLIFTPHIFWIPAIIIYRLVEGFNYRLCIIFVDKYKVGWGLRSLNRSLMLLLINYFEMIIGFALLYVYSSSIAGYDMIAINNSWKALYFSIVTITTLGYGDITPINTTGEILVTIETLMGFVFFVLVVSTFITGVSGIKNLRDGE